MHATSDSAPARATAFPSAEADLSVCRAILAEGSKSFDAAARLFPRTVRDRATAVYAFCRVADDAVDHSRDPAGAIDRLGRRLDRIHAGRPDDDPVDRSLARVVEAANLPRLPFDMLLEGFAWDAQGRTYPDLADLRAYAVRVAATAGVLMSTLMERRDRTTLARACDLGVAMQLTNIARDFASDARAGRVYLPARWLEAVGIDPGDPLANRCDRASLARLVARLLDEADGLYARSLSGIPRLPAGCRIAIRAAGLVYAEIGVRLRTTGCDPLSGRVFVSGPRKAVLLVRSLPAVVWRPLPSDAPPLPEAEALVDGSAAP